MKNVEWTEKSQAITLTLLILLVARGGLGCESRLFVQLVERGLKPRIAAQRVQQEITQANFVAAKFREELATPTLRFGMDASLNAFLSTYKRFGHAANLPQLFKQLLLSTQDGGEIPQSAPALEQAGLERFLELTSLSLAEFYGIYSLPVLRLVAVEYLLDLNPVGVRLIRRLPSPMGHLLPSELSDYARALLRYRAQADLPYYPKELVAFSIESIRRLGLWGLLSETDEALLLDLMNPLMSYAQSMENRDAEFLRLLSRRVRFTGEINEIAAEELGQRYRAFSHSQPQSNAMNQWLESLVDSIRIRLIKSHLSEELRETIGQMQSVEDPLEILSSRMRYLKKTRNRRPSSWYLSQEQDWFREVSLYVVSETVGTYFKRLRRRDAQADPSLLWMRARQLTLGRIVEVFGPDRHLLDLLEKAPGNGSERVMAAGSPSR